MTSPSIIKKIDLLNIDTPSIILPRDVIDNSDNFMDMSNNLRINDVSQIYVKENKCPVEFNKNEISKNKKITFDQKEKIENNYDPNVFDSPLRKPIKSPLSKPLTNNAGREKIELNSMNVANHVEGKEEAVLLTRKSRYWMYALILTVNVVTNLENGTIPACTDKIEKDMKINEQALGLFGSALYTGNLVAAFIVMYIINTLSRKWLFIVTFFFNGLFVFLFTTWENLVFLYLIRFLSGLSQVYVVIYNPVWVDQFGPRNKKTLMMTLLQVTGPLAIVLGFAMTTIITDSGLSWKWSFRFQGMLYGIFSVVLMFIPNVYFSNLQSCHSKKEEAIKNEIEKCEGEEAMQNKSNANQFRQVSNADNFNEEQLDREERIINNNNRPNNSENRQEDNNRSNNFENDQNNIENKNKIKDVEDDTISLFEYKMIDDSEVKSFWKNFFKIIKMKVYMLCVVTNAILFFISTVIQYWTVDYLKKVIVAPSNEILVMFIITCITGPTTGIIFGGFFVSKFGGYESKTAPVIVSAFAIFAFIFAIPITQFNSLGGFAVFLWLFLFFGGATLPNLVGLQLTSLPHELRASGNSSANVFNNIIGFIPAPFFYGSLFDATKNTSPKFAYGFCLMYSFTCIILMIIATIIRRKQIKEIEAAEAAEVAAEGNMELENRVQTDKNKSAAVLKANMSRDIEAVGISQIKIEIDDDDEISPRNDNLKKSVLRKDSKESQHLENKIKNNKIGSNSNNKSEILKNCVSMKEKIMDGKLKIEVAKYNSENPNVLKKFKTNIYKNNVRPEDICFKGENGNQEIFEIKFNKIEKDEVRLHNGDNNDHIEDNFYSSERKPKI